MGDYKINGRVVSKEAFEEIQRLFAETGNGVEDIFADDQLTENEITKFLDSDKNGKISADDFRFYEDQERSAKIFGDIRKILMRHGYDLNTRLASGGLKNSPDFIRKDRDIVLAAVSRNGLSLEYAHPSLQKDPKIVLAAVGQNGMAWQFADPILRKNHEIAFAAVRQMSVALQKNVDLRFRIAAAAVRIALETDVDVSKILMAVERTMRTTELRTIVFPLIQKKPHYLKAVAPELVKFQTKLALQAYQFGITRGHRFTEYTLRAAVKNHLLAKYDVNDPRPLAIVIAGKWDDNGAFQGVANRYFVTNRAMFFTRYYEFDSVDDAVNAIRDATQRRKAAIIEFAAHGSPYNVGAIRTGGNIDDWESVRHAVLDGGFIVSGSCSNAEGGRGADNILDFLSRIFPQAYVVASETNRSVPNTMRFNKKIYFGGFDGHGNSLPHVLRREPILTYYKPDEIKPIPYPAFSTTASEEKKKNLMHRVASTDPDPEVREAASSPLSPPCRPPIFQLSIPFFLSHSMKLGGCEPPWWIDRALSLMTRYSLMRQSTNTKSYSIRGVSVDIIGLDGLLTPIRANDIGIIDYMTVGIRAGFGVSAGSVTEFHSKIGPVAQAQLKAPVPLFLSVNPFIGYTSLSSKSLNSVKAPGVDLSLRYMFNHRYRWNEGRPKIESAADDGWGLTLEYGYMGKFGKDYIHTVGVGVLYRFF